MALLEPNLKGLDDRKDMPLSNFGNHVVESINHKHSVPR